MPELINEQKVCAVKSAEDLHAFMKDIEKFSLKTLLLRVFLIGWVALANVALALLKYLLFKTSGYKTKDHRNIVVYTVGIVGDNVAMLPALAAVRRRYPQAYLTVITNCQTWSQRAAEGILGPSRFKDRLIILDDDPVQRQGIHFIIADKRLTELKCDLFVNLSPFGNRGVIGTVMREIIFAKKIGAQYAVGFKMATYSKRGIFNKVQYHFVQNEPRRPRKVLKELGLMPAENEDLFASDSSAQGLVREKIHALCRPEKDFFVINPGAKFKAKCWPAERFGAVAKHIGQSFNAFSVVTGALEEQDIIAEVTKSSGGFGVNLADGTTLQELAELLRMARGCVTNDTGTMHMAAMIGIPTIAIFSMRHSPTHWLPIGKNVIVLFTTPDCICCYDDYCDTSECLKLIETSDVIRALQEVLAASNAKK